MLGTKRLDFNLGLRLFQSMRSAPGNDLNLGFLAGRNATLSFPRTARDKHLYICGGTGTGKSKFLEHLIRQDIKNWHRSKCGLILFDPHGSLYDSLVEWLAWNERILDVPIIPIDLRQDDWVVSYNLLRHRKAEPSVLIDNLTSAVAHVWGQGNTNETPLFARWVGNILRALYENKLTLVEAEHLVDRVAKQMRFLITANMKDKLSQQDWQFANTLSPEKFESQIGSTVNRLQRFIRNGTMRAMFGQSKNSLDLGRALEDGSIILVSLATERAKVSKENAELFATLLLSDLWTAAQERGKRRGVKPFYVYADEFQRFVTPTIADNFDEARGFGLHLTVAHQFPNQLLDRGENGKRVYNSIMENASSKVVFRLTHEENLRVMAQWLFMGAMDPEEVKHELYSTKVMNYREETREVLTESTSSGESSGSHHGHAEGAGHGGSENFFDGEETLRTNESSNQFASGSEGESSGWSESKSESRSETTVLVPVLGQELSHVQFRSLEEQLFRAMAALFDQKERFGVARLVEMKAPVSLRVPDVSKVPNSPERTKAFLDRAYAKLPFALPGSKAQLELTDRAKQLAGSIATQVSEDEGTGKRRIR